MASLSSLAPGYNGGPPLGRPNVTGVYVGIVMANDDVQRMGRLSVWIPELGGNPTDPTSWLVVNYASPFAGCTDITQVNASSQTMDGSQQSYGWWAVPPDKNNEVLIGFVNGDLARGFWFACIWQQNMNHMVPGVASNYTTPPDGGKSGKIPIAPVVEYNKKNVQSTTDPLRPAFTPLVEGLATEGLSTDYERGPSSTSARREAPSKVFGYLTPRANTQHIDDNSENEFIRLRTRSGTQILIHESTGYVYINSKLGNAWLEVSDKGVDVYSANAISLRAEKDFNVRADGDINLDAGGAINLRAGGAITLGAGKNLELLTASDIRIGAAGHMSTHTVGDLTIKSDGSIHLQSAIDFTVKAGGTAARDAPTIADNGGVSPDVTADDAQTPIGKTAPDVKIGGNGPTSATKNTIVSRMPTHEPWVGHPQRGVPGALGEMENPYPGTGTVPTGTGNVTASPPQEQQCGVAHAKTMSNTAFNAFKEGADKTGLPLDLIMAVGDRESGFNPTAHAPTSSATGIMQITSGTFHGLLNQYGAQDNVTADPNDTRTSVLMGARYLQQSKQNLVNAGVANPTYGQIYSGYFLGPSDQAKLAQAAASNSSTPLSQLLPKAYAANHNAMRNPDGTVMNAQQFTQSLDRDIASRAAPYAAQNDLPAPCDRPGAVNTAGLPGNQPSTGGTTPGLAKNYKSYVGQSIGSGQCVAYVQAAAGLPNTHQWTRGDPVSADTPPGTALATFDPNGSYGNHEDGTSHALILDHTDETGFYAYEQYQGQSVHLKHYSYGAAGTPIRNAANYSVINVKS